MSLWSSDGTLLASGTFTGESGSGWQELDFSSPVAVTAGTTYVASYHTDAGHYAFTSGGLAQPVANGALTALASGGVYAYGSGNVFPSAPVTSTVMARSIRPPGSAADGRRGAAPLARAAPRSGGCLVIVGHGVAASVDQWRSRRRLPPRPRPGGVSRSAT